MMGLERMPQKNVSIVLTVQTGVGNIPHGVLKSPDNRVDDQLELLRRNLQKSYSPESALLSITTFPSPTHLGNKSS